MTTQQKEKARERARKWREDNRERHRAYSRRYHQEHKPALGEVTCECKECGSRFQRPGKRGPIPRLCADCVATYSKRHYARNRERRKAESRAWTKANPEKVRERSARRRRDDPDRIREYQRQDRIRHADRERAKTKRRRALIEGCPEREHVSPQQICERDEWQCHVCGGAVSPLKKFPDPWSPTLDHVVPLVAGGPHTSDNIKLAHMVCNSRKGAT